MPVNALGKQLRWGKTESSGLEEGLGLRGVRETAFHSAPCLWCCRAIGNAAEQKHLEEAEQQQLLAGIPPVVLEQGKQPCTACENCRSSSRVYAAAAKTSV